LARNLTPHLDTWLLEKGAGRQQPSTHPDSPLGDADKLTRVIGSRFTSHINAVTAGAIDAIA